MNTPFDISDEQFVPFLQSLGVETFKKSFDWMLNDRDFAGVLHWIYDSLDHNNALTAREECRYLELEQRGQLLSLDALETSLTQIQEQHEGICLPGNPEGLRDAKLKLDMLKDKLNILEKQGDLLKDLENNSRLTKKELSLEMKRLNAANQQCLEDQKSAADECISLAQEVEDITDGVVDVIADVMELYSSCHTDEDIAKKFYTFGPFEAYQQSQALFRFHYDLYTSKKFIKRRNDGTSDEEVRNALIEANIMEERLSDTVYAYTKSKAELSGLQSKLSLVTDYSTVHPSQVADCLIEVQSELNLLEQEESILNKQLELAVKQFVESHTNHTVETIEKTALAIRQQIHDDLTCLLDTTRQTLFLDRVLYIGLRHELNTTQNCLQFAADLREHVLSEAEAVNTRINSMNEICSQQEICALNIQSSNELLHMLFKIFGVTDNNWSVLPKLHMDQKLKAQELRDSIAEAYKMKEDAINDMEVSTKPLREYVWDGCNKKPNSRDRTVEELTHTLRQCIGEVDKKIYQAGNKFITIKEGDKHSLRKLWQWFLTDRPRFLSAMDCDG